MSRLEQFRARKDKFFRTHANSPLLPEQQAAFNALHYYPEDPELRFEVTLEAGDVSHDPVEVETSTGEPKVFIPAGHVHLTIADQPVRLLVYKEPGRGRYFLPFRDATSGLETYGAGRYLDPQETPNGTLIVDFNYAYNPYCAYGDRFSCPLPPFENWVKVPINAGERTSSMVLEEVAADAVD